MAKVKKVVELTDEEIAVEKTKYTRKIESPIYEPKKIAPLITELYDTSKRDELIKEINKETLPPKLRDFLISAAERHTVFDFGNIADFYAHIPVKFKYLFENSALVIIDYDNAIRNGFISFEKEVDISREDYLENIITKEQYAENKEEIAIKKQKRAEEELEIIKNKRVAPTTDLGSW